ncbi:MAG TPA: DUF948 domain-containing protein [Gemmatimonadales bacterium]|nr:DUF948 domain-containing protein [Gemmatimonadales bacterium]
MPTWVPVTVALSLLVIALSFLAIAVGILVTLRALDRKLSPAFKSLSAAAEHTEKLSALVRREGEGLTDTTKRVRESINGGLERVEGRLQDLDALYEVLYEELKETGLEAGVMMRRLRRPGSWWGRVRRIIG